MADLIWGAKKQSGHCRQGKEDARVCSSCHCSHLGCRKQEDAGAAS